MLYMQIILWNETSWFVGGFLDQNFYTLQFLFIGFQTVYFYTYKLLRFA